MGLFSHRRARSQPGTGRTGPVYAVGDIHGRADLLKDLLGRIVREAPGWAGPPLIVFLGDYVDRGPASRQVLEALVKLAADRQIETAFLRGNHEDMLLRFLGAPETGPAWIEEGGIATLESYGLKPVGPGADPAALEGLARRLAAAMGPHLAFLKATLMWHRSGDLLFAHAGADPAQPPDRQSAQALLWGHPDFMTRARRGGRQRRDGLWVVHGHIVVPLGYAEEGRIAVDTGAYATGRLTAARIDGAGIGFVAT